MKAPVSGGAALSAVHGKSKAEVFGMSGKFSLSNSDLFVLAVRYAACIVCPPLAVLDKGLKVILLVALFTLFGWLPGTVVAFYICLRDRNYYLQE